jgi:hypothetical protein
MGDYKWWQEFGIGRLQIVILWPRFVLFGAHTWWGLDEVRPDNPVFRQVTVLSVCFRWWYKPTFELKSTE